MKLTTFLLLTPCVYAFPYRRATIDPSSLSDSYDFVIVGGGLAGLVIASRLSEDSSTSVLVLEAGPNGDDVRDRIDRPGVAYYNGILADHNWGWTTVPQPNAGNRVMDWPGGKILGGSSAANGQYYVRPSSVEVDVWNSLINGMDGADNWSSESFFAAMRKGEQFTPPSDSIRTLGQIQYVESSHGSNGPLHTTYPAYLPDVVGRWISSLVNAGIPASTDGYGGDASGAYISASTINPTNWTRSYSRSAYIDPYYRPNLHILTNAPVAHIKFDGKKANAVEYGTDGKTVKVNKEVIISAGPMGSPSLLMHSGIGPKDVLAGVGITPVVELPGVGHHLQDHLSVQSVFRTNAETAATVYANTSDPRSTTNEFLSYVNCAIAYANTAQLMGDANAFRNDVNSHLDAAISALPGADDTVKAGYKAIYQVYADKLLTSNAGQVEILLSTTGTTFGPDTLAIQTALQRPFGQGHMYINSSNPFDKLVIDPGYFSHPSDLEMLREAVKLARSIAGTEPLNGAITEELSPGKNITSDEDLNNFIINSVHTEFHPSASCAMLPKELGGVVDAKLKVYGLDNVRVADSSVFPVEFAAHMMAPTYGLAEQAATIIKAQYSGNNNVNNNNNNNGHKGAAIASMNIAPTLWIIMAAVGILSFI